MRASDVLRNARSEFRIEFVTEVSRLDALGAAWKALSMCQPAHDPSFFQSFAWSKHVAGFRSARSGNSYRVCVAKVLHNQRLVGLWPLSLQRQSSAWLVRNLDAPFGQFAGVAFEDSSVIAPSILAIVEALRRQNMADGMLIESVIANSYLHNGLAAAGLRVCNGIDAVAVDLRSFANFADYSRTVSAKTRKNLRNLLNRLQRNGPTAFAVVTEPARIREIIENSFTDRVRWLNTHGKSSTAFRNSDFRELVVTLPDEPDINLRAFALLHYGNVIAQQWGFIHGNCYYAYISSRKPEFAHFSAGRIHLGGVIRSCFEDELRMIELMPPDADYKMTWTNRTRRLDTFAVAFTTRGHLVLDLWLTRFEPALRRISHRLPLGTRRRLAALINGAS